MVRWTFFSICFLFACVITLSGSFSSVAGGFFTSARLIHLAGQKKYLPSLFGRLHPTRGTPVNAMALQALLAIFYIVVGGGFRSLVNFCEYT